jgi:hypothetical protein
MMVCTSDTVAELRYGFEIEWLGKELVINGKNRGTNSPVKVSISSKYFYFIFQFIEMEYHLKVKVASNSIIPLCTYSAIILLTTIFLISQTQPFAIASQSSLKDRQEYAQNIPMVFPLTNNNDHVTKSSHSSLVPNNFLDSYYNAFDNNGTGTQFHQLQTSPGSNTWSEWFSLGGKIATGPAVAVNSDGRLQVFAVATDNQLWFRTQSSAGSATWSAWTSLGGNLKSDPAVARNRDGRLEVFVIGEGSTGKTGILLPLYMYPTLWQAGNPWEKLANIAKAHPTIPIHAIINPNSGPGTQQDINFVNGIDMLKAAGVKVWGYTYTQYGTRLSSNVKSDIDKYATFYPGLHGIIFDQMENQAGSETYYTDLTQYAKSKGFVMTGGNPGASTASSYVGTADTLTIYEDSSIPSSQTLASRTFNGQYDKKNFNYVSYAVSSLNEAAIRATLSYVGFLYVTNDVPPNPWDTLPSYLDQLVGILES